MNLIADQDRILQLVENENDSREIPMRDNESEHQEGRKEHTEILDIRKRTRTRQENQTERMLKRRRSELQPGEVGDSVTIAIPRVDRGRGDARNITGVITYRQRDDFYKVGVKQFAARSLLSQSV